MTDCPKCQGDGYSYEDQRITPTRCECQRSASGPSDATTCSALVTRYPTGCFGIDYNGSVFHWWGFVEADVHAELERLRIPAKRVKWEERYYDRRYDFNDPRSYKTRKFIPQKTTKPMRGRT
jgi:hypothetical protein